MLKYKSLKISTELSEENIDVQINNLGELGWELVNFQPSSESHGVLKNNKAWTTTYILIFKKEVLD